MRPVMRTLGAGIAIAFVALALAPLASAGDTPAAGASPARACHAEYAARAEALAADAKAALAALSAAYREKYAALAANSTSGTVAAKERLVASYHEEKRAIDSRLASAREQLHAEKRACVDRATADERAAKEKLVAERRAAEERRKLEERAAKESTRHVEKSVEVVKNACGEVERRVVENRIVTPRKEVDVAKEVVRATAPCAAPAPAPLPLPVPAPAPTSPTPALPPTAATPTLPAEPVKLRVALGDSPLGKLLGVKFLVVEFRDGVLGVRAEG